MQKFETFEMMEIISLCFIFTLDINVSAVFHMVQMLIISVATCTSSLFVYLEKYALRNQYIEVNTFSFIPKYYLPIQQHLSVFFFF